MQQVNGNLIVMNPGDMIDDTYNDYLKIYLAGSLDFGPRMPWQQKFINGLSMLATPHPESPNIPDYSKYKFVVFNPLVPMNGGPDLNNPDFINKMQWENNMMQSSDAIFFNFLKRASNFNSTIFYYLFAQSGKMVCRCPNESIFFPYLKTISDFYGIPFLGDTGSVITVMDTMFNYIPKFVELSKYNL